MKDNSKGHRLTSLATRDAAIEEAAKRIDRIIDTYRASGVDECLDDINSLEFARDKIRALSTPTSGEASAPPPLSEDGVTILLQAQDEEGGPIRDMTTQERVVTKELMAQGFSFDDAFESACAIAKALTAYADKDSSERSSMPDSPGLVGYVPERTPSRDGGYAWLKPLTYASEADNLRLELWCMNERRKIQAGQTRHYSEKLALAEARIAELEATPPMESGAGARQALLTWAGAASNQHQPHAFSREELQAGIKQLAAALASSPTEQMREALDEAQFLLSRIDELDWCGDFPEQFLREWNGHVDPPLSRLRRALERVDQALGGNHD